MRATTFTTLLITVLLVSTSSTRSVPPTSAALASAIEPPAIVGETSVASLSRRGPQVTGSFDSNDFAMFYIVRGNWPLVLRYELAKGSGKLQLKALQRGGLIVAELPATSEGKVGKVMLTVPLEYGEAPQPAELRITAYGPANLVLHSLGCGGGAFVNPADQRRRLSGYAPENRNHFQHFLFTETQQVGSDEVAIAGIILSPRDILDASKGDQLSFSFRSANDFPMWSATFERQVQGSGSRWQVERILPFANDPINQGQTKKNSWDGKNQRGKVVSGRYKLMVNAWTSAVQDGSALTSFSSPAFTVK